MKTYIRKISSEQLKSRMPGTMASISDVWYIEGNGFYKYSEAVEYASKHGLPPENIYKKSEFVDFVDKTEYFVNGNYNHMPSDMELDLKTFQITDNTDLIINIPTPVDSYYRKKGDEYYSLENFSVDNVLKTITTYKSNTYDTEKLEFYCYIGNDIYYCDDILSDVDDIINGVIDGCFKKRKYITYHTLKKWYHFFEEYYDYLHSSDTKYETLYDMKVSNPSLLALTEQECADMDALFIARGGKDFYDYISSTSFARFDIPKQYVGYWGVKYLYYPDASKWAAWFDGMYRLYGGVENVYECSEYSGCCNCEEYVNRGGDEMYFALNEWIDGVVPNKYVTNSASLTLPLLLQTSIYDIGQMSIFSERYDNDEDYHSTINGDSSNGGTVVINDNNGYIISGGNSYASSLQYTGHRYDKDTMKNVFDAEQWGDYYDNFRKNNINDFYSYVNSYAVSHNNVVIYNPTDKTMTVKYNVYRSDNGFIPIKGVEYEILMMPYVTYFNKNVDSPNNGVDFPVYSGSDDVYYTEIDGNTYYAINKNGWYYFNFNIAKECNHPEDYDCKMVSPTRCIIYGDRLVKTEFVKQENRTVEVVDIFDGKQDILYKKVNGYTYIDDIKYYITGGTREVIVGDSVFANYNDGVFIVNYNEPDADWINDTRYPSVSDDYVTILYPYTKIMCDNITGTTSSMLGCFYPKRFTVDDFGNIMPGYYDFKVDYKAEKEWFNNNMPDGNRINSKTSQPYDGVMLDWYIKVGDTSELTVNEELTDNNNLFKQYYDGNIIQKIKFYYINDLNGDIIDDSVVELSNDKFSDGKYYRVHNWYFDKYCEDNNIKLPDVNYDDILKVIDICKMVKSILLDIYECADCGMLFKNESITDLGTCPNCGSVNIDYVGIENVNVSDNMYCTIEYNIGAILHKRIEVNEEGEDITYTFNGYEIEKSKTTNGTKYHPGVMYSDTAEIIDDLCQYMLGDGTCYNLRYHRLSYNTGYTNSEDGTVLTFNESKFSMPVMTYDSNGDVANRIYYEENGMGKDNNTTMLPTYREEYNNGIVFPNTIDTDIYVDRGIFKSLDRHLKLQEIMTMEALENYGNSSFKIME